MATMNNINPMVVEPPDMSDGGLNVGKLMTRIIWGDEVANSGWVDPTYK